MINEEKTFKEFKYYSTDLKPKSHKKVWVICNKCGKERILRFQDYTDLCRSCANKNRKHSEETKQKMSNNHSGKNNPFFGKHHSEEVKQKISKNGYRLSGKNHPMYGKHPSKETREKMSKSHLGKYTGEKHHNWNPNLTDEERQNNRSYPEYLEWRKLVFEKDNYTCQICGSSGNNLNAHHLESYNSNKKLRTTLSNGMTLCNICHNNFHHQYGKGNNTKEQLIEFV